LEAANRDLLQANQSCAKEAEGDGHAASQDFEIWKDHAYEEFTKHNGMLENELQSLRASHAKALVDLNSKWAQKMKAVEMLLSQKNENLQTALESSQARLGAATDAAACQMDAWALERDALDRGWQQDRLALIASFDDQKKEMVGMWEVSQAKLIKHLEDENARLRDGWAEDRTEVTEVTGELKSVTESLQRTLENFGDTIGLRSKGDAY
jgi:hypothetical protein